MDFYVGLHQPADAHAFERCMVSVNRLRTRKSDFRVRAWMMDSGAFTEVTQHGGYRHGVEEYAEAIHRWSRCGELRAAVAQDYMCEPFALKRTGLTVEQHQTLTVERYLQLRALVRGSYVLPVLQGWEPADYVRHVEIYGTALERGAWVGVGSVCKRNAKPQQIEAVLLAIHKRRPDLRLHGFGVKMTALSSELVRSLLHSADSMAWSFAARYEGRDANDPTEAARYVQRLERQAVQGHLFFRGGA
jgi:hypothetical protein